MLAILALICFILVLFKVSVGTIDLTTLGFAFIAAYLLWPWTPGASTLPWHRNRT